MMNLLLELSEQLRSDEKIYFYLIYDYQLMKRLYPFDCVRLHPGSLLTLFDHTIG